MALPNVFRQETIQEIYARLNKLNANSKPNWGKMNVGQMLAHCNVTYEMVYENKYPKPKFVKKFVLKRFVKPIVVSEKPYQKNGRTAPQFLITGEREFNEQKERLHNYIQKTADLGEAHFDGKESHSFGPLNKTEWNNMFYKHLDHHLTQFGV